MLSTFAVHHSSCRRPTWIPPEHPGRCKDRIEQVKRQSVAASIPDEALRDTADYTTFMPRTNQKAKVRGKV